MFGFKQLALTQLSIPLIDELLRMNTDNRQVNSHKVEWMKKTMLEGGWTLIGKPLKINKGVLINGQHRLLAAKEALEENPNLKIKLLIKS